MRKYEQPNGLVAVILLCVVLNGCSSNPEVRFTSEDCRKVWLWSDRGNHSELIVRLRDLPDPGFDQLSEIPTWANFMGIGIFDVEYIKGERSKLQALLPSPAGLWISFYETSPELMLSNLDYVPIVMTNEMLQNVWAYAKSDAVTDHNGKVQLIDGLPISVTGGSDRSLTLTLAANRPYSAFNFCHSWVLRGLKQAGFTDLPSMVYRSSDMLFLMDHRFPRAEQICPGYINNSAKNPRAQSYIRKHTKPLPPVGAVI